jgi:hypothetical protein
LEELLVDPFVVLSGDDDGTTSVEDGADKSCVGDTTDGATVSDVDNVVGIKLGPRTSLQCGDGTSCGSRIGLWKLLWFSIAQQDRQPRQPP